MSCPVHLATLATQTSQMLGMLLPLYDSSNTSRSVRPCHCATVHGHRAELVSTNGMGRSAQPLSLRTAGLMPSIAQAELICYDSVD